MLKVREFGGDGLFTSWTHEKNWQKAHRILLPSFSQKAMKGYHSMMLDIAMQLVQKWSRLNPNEEIDVAEDMTRLTLDTICADFITALTAFTATHSILLSRACFVRCRICANRRDTACRTS